MEEYTTGTGQKIKVHNKKDCKGEYCSIHNPSNHHMKNWPTNWRSDKGIMERICPHGVGHPDPDDLSFKEEIFKKRSLTLFDSFEVRKKYVEDSLKTYAIHGCDGCCSEPFITEEDTDIK